MSDEELELAQEIVDSKAYKQAELDTYDERKGTGYWLAACLNKDWIGISKNMVVKGHKGKMKQFILKKDSPLIDYDYYTHHCPVCDGIVFNPKEALEDPLYDFNRK